KRSAPADTRSRKPARCSGRTGFASSASSASAASCSSQSNVETFGHERAPGWAGGGKEALVSRQSWSNTSVTPGQAARSAWNGRPEAEREIAALSRTLPHLEADLAYLTEVGKRWAPEGEAKAR